MRDPRPGPEPFRNVPETRDRNGLAVHCAEAQADGVPCFEIGADCTCCDRAVMLPLASGRPRRLELMESLAIDPR